MFSYWKLIGNPTALQGYKKGMILRNGTFAAGTGGGLCQLSAVLMEAESNGLLWTKVGPLSFGTIVSCEVIYDIRLLPVT